MKFSANLTGLWSYLDLPEAISKAAEAGFDAVECQWPYVHYPIEIALALEKSHLPMISLATAAGDLSKGESGLAAFGTEIEAQAAIKKAIVYAIDISCRNIKLLAGNASGKTARQKFVQNLRYACESADAYGIGVLLEPLNSLEYAGYFLTSITQAVECLEQVNLKNAGLLFDYYQVSKMGLDPVVEFAAHFEHINHVSIASYPSFQEPQKDDAELVAFLREVRSLGFEGYIGANYLPSLPMTESLRWLEEFSVYL